MDPRDALRRRNLRPKKRLGQNFLVTRDVAARIAGLAVGEPGDRVLEIGAGTGALTAALAALGAAVTALEIDDDLVTILRERDDLRGVTIEHVDAMQFDYDAYAGDAPWRVAGNLPYNVGTPLVIELVTRPHPPLSIVAMLQKDVVDRLVAKPATPAYGSLTLLASYQMQIKRAFTIGPSHFHPRPNVDSSVVVFERIQPRVDASDPAFLYKVVRGSFAYRRKTLANSLLLSLEIPRERTVAVLQSLALDPETRAEQLDLGAFAALAAAVAP